MLNIFTKNRIKIVLVLLTAFISVKLIVPNLFIADSPRINPIFIANVINTPARIAAIPGKFLSSLSKFNFFNNNGVNTNINTNTNSGMIAEVKYVSPNPTIKANQEIIAKAKYVTPSQNIIFKYMSKGVSAAEDPGTGMKYIKVEAGTKYKIVGYITLDGVQYPKIEFIE